MQHFEQEILKAIGGVYSFQDGITIASDQRAPWVDWHAVDKHESIHCELVDMSVYGWFQRVMLDLKSHQSVPESHRKHYLYVFRELLKNCTQVHEGVAYFREWLWYSGWTNNAPIHLQHVPGQYRESFECVASLVPGEYAKDPTMQAAYHSVCDLIGVYLLNAPLSYWYSDYSRLEEPELKYISAEGPHFRLKQLAQHRVEVSAVLKRYLPTIEQLIRRDLSVPGAGLSPDYWQYFRNTIAELAQVAPELPTICDVNEQRAAQFAMFDRWNEKFPYISEIFDVDGMRARAPVDVGHIKAVYGSRFGSLNSETAADDFDEDSIESPLEYIGRIAEIYENKDIAFMICVCNPTPEALPITDNQKLSPDAIGGCLLSVDRDALESDICLPGNTIRTFAFRYSVLSSFEYPLIGLFPVVRYMRISHYRKITEKDRIAPCPHIIRISEFIDFEEILQSKSIDYCGCWEQDKIRIFGCCTPSEFYLYPANIMQEMEISKMLSSIPSLRHSAPSYELGSGIQISATQMAALAFLGMDMKKQNSSVVERQPRTDNGKDEMSLLRRLFRGRGHNNPEPRQKAAAGNCSQDDDLKAQLKASGYTGHSWICGRCKTEYNLPAKIGAKMISCSYCGFLIPNKAQGEPYEP